MEAATIDKIAALAVNADKAVQLSSTTIPTLIKGEKLISIEHLMSGRARFRGRFETSVLSEFAGYLKANQGGVGYIGADSCTAKVYLNLGTQEKPGHGDWTASLKLEPTAAYAALRRADGVRFEQKQLVEWIEDWAALLDAEQGMPYAIASIRNLTISTSKDVTHTDKDFGASRSSLESIEAKSGAGIPSHLQFTCTPYLGFMQRTFKLRLSVITGDKPGLTLRIVGREQLDEDIAKEFKASLIENVGDAATMTIGSFTP